MISCSTKTITYVTCEAYFCLSGGTTQSMQPFGPTKKPKVFVTMKRPKTALDILQEEEEQESKEEAERQQTEQHGKQENKDGVKTEDMEQQVKHEDTKQENGGPSHLHNAVPNAALSSHDKEAQEQHHQDQSTMQQVQVTAEVVTSKQDDEAPTKIPEENERDKREEPERQVDNEHTKEIREHGAKRKRDRDPVEEINQIEDSESSDKNQEPIKLMRYPNLLDNLEETEDSEPITCAQKPSISQRPKGSEVRKRSKELHINEETEDTDVTCAAPRPHLPRRAKAAIPKCTSPAQKDNNDIEDTPYSQRNASRNKGRGRPRKEAKSSQTIMSQIAHEKKSPADRKPTNKLIGKECEPPKRKFTFKKLKGKTSVPAGNKQMTDFFQVKAIPGRSKPLTEEELLREVSNVFSSDSDTPPPTPWSPPKPNPNQKVTYKKSNAGGKYIPLKKGLSPFRYNCGEKMSSSNLRNIFME